MGQSDREGASGTCTTGACALVKDSLRSGGPVTLTGIPTEGYAFLMGQSLCIMCALLSWAVHANVSEAAEFYSWTDASGLVTHQFPNVPPAAESSGTAGPSQRNSQAGGSPNDGIDLTPRSDSQAKPRTSDINDPL